MAAVSRMHESLQGFSMALRLANPRTMWFSETDESPGGKGRRNLSIFHPIAAERSFGSRRALLGPQYRGIGALFSIRFA